MDKKGRPDSNWESVFEKISLHPTHPTRKENQKRQIKNLWEKSISEIHSSLYWLQKCSYNQCFQLSFWGLIKHLTSLKMNTKCVWHFEKCPFFCISKVLQLATLPDTHDLYTISIGAWFPLNESIRLWSVVGRLMSSSFRFIWAVNLNLTANTDCSLMIKRKINFRDNIAFVALVSRLQCCQLYILVKIVKLMKE